MLCSPDSPIFAAETQEAIKVSSTWQSPRARWRSPGSYKAFINKMTLSLTGLRNDCFFLPTEDPRWGGQPVDSYPCHCCQNTLWPLRHPESSLASCWPVAGHWLELPPLPKKGKKVPDLRRGVNNRLHPSSGILKTLAMTELQADPLRTARAVNRPTGIMGFAWRIHFQASVAFHHEPMRMPHMTYVSRPYQGTRDCWGSQ